MDFKNAKKFSQNVIFAWAHNFKILYFSATQRDISPYVSEDWETFQNLTDFSSTSAMISNNNNPIYTQLTPEAIQFIEENHNIYPFGFIR